MNMAMEKSAKRALVKSFGVVVRLCAIAFFVCLFAYLTLTQLSSVKEVEAQISAVQKDIAYEESVKSDLLKQADYLGSDVFIEKVARERLQMIRKDEILFVVNR